MSAKWVRAKAWDDRHLNGLLRPLKWLLRLFSSVYFGVWLLALVVLYGILASIPIGLIALAPTYAVYGLSLLAVVGVFVGVPVLALHRAFTRRRTSQPGRSAAAIHVASLMLTGLALVLTSCWLWYAFAWPVMRYDVYGPEGPRGLRLFASFVERYQSIQFRRLPGVEMSELEFYSWWPLSAILILFVTTMTIATLRRIEFTFPRVGVLMVHTGIITIALGSLYYAKNKQEGDMLLVAGEPTPDGATTPGREETGFYDNTATALWITQDKSKGWEQRRLVGLPRYNDYNLLAVPGAALPDYDDRVPPGTALTPAMQINADAHRHRNFPPLAIEVPGEDARAGYVDDDISLRIIGYASYAALEKRWVEAQPGDARRGPEALASLREVEAILSTPDRTAAGKSGPSKVWQLVPESPARRADALELLSVEYTRGMDEQRWLDLSARLPARTQHGLVIEVPGKAFKSVFAPEIGQATPVGDTGWTITLERLEARPPFPIVTPGYQGATSSLAVVRIKPPDARPEFSRWIYSRFPELSQDLFDEKTDRGTQLRRTADPAIRIAYVDASMVRVNFDESASGAVRAMLRLPGGPPVITDSVPPGGEFQVAPALSLRLGKRLDSVGQVEVPVVPHPEDRDKNLIGNHKAAAIALQVTEKSGAVETLWLPFTQYLLASGDTMRSVTLASGRTIHLAFGRVRHEFSPTMSVRLLDFDMTPYPHSAQPRDFKSEVLVSSRWNGVYKDTPAKTSLNDPLLVKTPFVPREDLSMFANLIGWTMSIIAPNQYKFAQAGWDQSGWRESQALVDSGQLKRPSARFTILGVGNNPGIYIIASGAMLMSLGIPWAFYLKPYLIRREKSRLQRLVAQGKIKPRGRSSSAGEKQCTPTDSAFQPTHMGTQP